jgi:alpha-L-rhamnosidase
MNSFNHYAYGAIGDWMYRVAAGIDTKENAPGYKEVVIKPHIGGTFTSMSAELQTLYGAVSSTWNVNDKSISLDVKVPVNTRATLLIPTESADKITEGNLPLSKSTTVKVKGNITDMVHAEINNSGQFHEVHFVEVEVGSGSYQFKIAR